MEAQGGYGSEIFLLASFLEKPLGKDLEQIITDNGSPPSPEKEGGGVYLLKFVETMLGSEVALASSPVGKWARTTLDNAGGRMRRGMWHWQSGEVDM